jgi:hypothetical protein
MAVAADVTRRIPAGWYPDRSDRSRRQWFDGTAWTNYFSAVPQRALSLVPDLEADPEFSYSLDLPFESHSAPTASREIAPKPTDEVVVEYSTGSPHSLRNAITFRDRVPAVLISSLVVGNVLVLGVLSRIL